MAITDLHDVTKTLTTLLAERVRQLNGDNAVEVRALPPDRLVDSTNTISLYLYHVAENPQLKNNGLGNGASHVREVPLPLRLFYILTAHNKHGSDFDAEGEQRLMGYAMKTLHDYPVITDSTEISGTVVMPDSIRGTSNTLEVILRPVTPEDAINFWTAEDQQTARLSAYYEVRTALIEPEPIERYAGPVLSIGTWITQAGSPSIASSESGVIFTLPAEAGGGDQQVASSPARTSATTPHNTFDLLGANLTAGVRRRLVLRNMRWQRELGLDELAIDLDLNASHGWSVTETSTRVRITVGDKIERIDETGATVDVEFFPGLYGVSIEAVLSEEVVAGRLTERRVRSNETTVSLGPRISTHSIAAGRITLETTSPFDLSYAQPSDDVSELEITLAIDGVVYQQLHVDDINDATDRSGHFAVSEARKLLIDPEFDVAVTATHAVLLIVEGAQAQPYWIAIA